MTSVKLMTNRNISARLIQRHRRVVKGDNVIEVIEAIKNRKDVDLPKISVCKLLGCVGLKEWGIRCCDRIDEAELIDFENVFIDIENFPDILLSSIGMIKCEDLLLNYITKEQFENCFHYIVELEKQARNINNFAAILRKSTVRNLVKLYLISKNMMNLQR